MSALPLPNARTQFIDADGAPIVGGQVFTYIPATTTPKSTWQDPGQTILNTNPIILDDLGSAAIWADGSVRQVVEDALGNLIWDEVTGNGLSGFAAIDFSNVSDTIFYTSGAHVISATTVLNRSIVLLPGAYLTGSSGVTLTIIGTVSAPIDYIFRGGMTVILAQDKNPWAHPEWFGAVANGVSDCLSAFQKCHVAHDIMKLGSAPYMLSSTYVISAGGKQILGDDHNSTAIAIASSTLDIIHLQGTGTSAASYPDYFRMRDVRLVRTVAPATVGAVTSTSSYMASGLRMDRFQHVYIEDVWSISNYIDFYSNSTVNVYWTRCQGVHTGGTGADSYFGWYVDGTSNFDPSGNISPNASNRYTDCVLAGSSAMVGKGFYFPGSYSDQYLFRCETTACDYGIHVEGLLSPTDHVLTDMRIVECVHSGFKQFGWFIKDITPFGTVTINGGFAEPTGIGSTIMIGILGAVNVSVTGGITLTGWNNPSCTGVSATSVSNLLIDGLILNDCTTPLNMDNVKDSQITASAYARTQAPNVSSAAMFTNTTNTKISVSVFGLAANQYINGVNMTSSCLRNSIDVSSISASAVTNKLLFNGGAITVPGYFGSGGSGSATNDATHSNEARGVFL